MLFSNSMESTMELISFPKPLVHVFVCVNDRSSQENPMPSCGPRIRKEDVKEIKLWIRQQGWTRKVLCTSCNCLGFCNPDASVVCVYPSGRFIKIASPQEIKEIILRELDGK